MKHTIIKTQKSHIRLILTTIALSVMFLASAQKVKKIYIPERGEWFNLEFTGNRMLPDSKDIKQEFGYSVSFSFMHELRFGRSHWSLGYGLGYGFYNYYNNLNIKNDPSTQQPVYTVLPSDSTYDLNRQSFQYIELPLELRFRTTSNKKGRYWRIYPYVKIGFRVKSYNLFEVGTYKVRDSKIQDSKKFKAGAGIRFGYWIFTLYGNYDLTPLYESVIIGETDLANFRTVNLGLSISM